MCVLQHEGEEEGVNMEDSWHLLWRHSKEKVRRFGGQGGRRGDSHELTLLRMYVCCSHLRHERHFNKEGESDRGGYL